MLQQQKPLPSRHLDAVDLMRILTVAGVVAVHVVTLTNSPQSFGANGFALVLHVNREIFFTITTLVLAYRYRSDALDLKSFFKRRYLLVATPYAVWSVIYWVADGSLRDSPAQGLGTLGLDLLTGGARYHMYFLLVTMQIYLLFPWLLRFVKWSRGAHGSVLALSLSVQVLFTAAVHYGVKAPSLLGLWIQNPDPFVGSYVFYVVAGAILADHWQEATAFARSHAQAISACTAVTVATTAALYVGVVLGGGATPLYASQVFQPMVTFESIAVIAFLLVLGLKWSGRPGGPWRRQMVIDGSQSSFGIYLVHPLVLQTLVVSGVATALAHLPGSDTWPVQVVSSALLLSAVIAISWLLSRLMRSSPLSMWLTGRDRVKREVVAVHTMRWQPGFGLAVLGTLLLATQLFASGGLAVPVDAQTGKTALLQATQTAPPVAVAAPPPKRVTGTVATVVSVTSGGLERQFQVLEPLIPKSTHLPVIVFLHGVDASVSTEEDRDEMLTYVDTGQAILVYPVGIAETWNAGTCCGAAQAQGIDDVSFLAGVVQLVAHEANADPHRVFVEGYSAGGRMAYRLACEGVPGVRAFIVIAALPAIACKPPTGQSVLAVAGTVDPETLYSGAPVSVAGLIGMWVALDQCGPYQGRGAGNLVTYSWQCQSGRYLELAAYQGANHVIFGTGGTGSTPRTSTVVWSYMSQLS